MLKFKNKQKNLYESQLDAEKFNVILYKELVSEFKTIN